jgi:glycosyltransferase involved in cell wall biosynthesis
MSARDVLCFSHLRWNFVFQRPNHLMSRFARGGRVLFIEEPVFDSLTPALECSEPLPNLIRVVPHVPNGTQRAESDDAVARLLAELSQQLQLEEPTLWFYTPMMLSLAGNRRGLVVYDCMDELSAFLHAPPELIDAERALLARADVVFTGGRALYEAKRGSHPNMHAMPSSVDLEFFRAARTPQADPSDQASLPRPRVGFFGVIDERMDLALLAALAQARPELQVVMIGPIVKIDPETLPRSPNLHWLGSKSYAELPSYLAGWDAAIMPFALNQATRFISPTKTPEFLAAGKAVVSTAIADVVEPYERLGLVRIGRTPAEFIAQVDAALQDDGASHAQRDAFLAGTSWDRTWERMVELMVDAEHRTGERVATQGGEAYGAAAAE